MFVLPLFLVFFLFVISTTAYCSQIHRNINKARVDIKNGDVLLIGFGCLIYLQKLSVFYQ